MEIDSCSICIRHSSWKMKGADKFCMIPLWSFWRQIEDSLSVLKIGSCEHTTNDIPTFSPQKRNVEIGPSERLLLIFGTKNRILKIGSCERASTEYILTWKTWRTWYCQGISSEVREFSVQGCYGFFVLMFCIKNQGGFERYRFTWKNRVIFTWSFWGIVLEIAGIIREFHAIKWVGILSKRISLNGPQKVLCGKILPTSQTSFFGLMWKFKFCRVNWQEKYRPFRVGRYCTDILRSDYIITGPNTIYHIW